MMIKCPECQKKISERASCCVYCGFPLRKYRNEEAERVKMLQQKKNGNLEKSSYMCKINGTVHNVKWILDILNKYSEKELSIIKKAAQKRMSLDYDVWLKYNPKGKEWDMDMERGELASEIRDCLDLSQEVANQFIYEILEHEKTIPQEFNGQTFTEWSNEQMKLSESEQWKGIFCPHCNSTNVEKRSRLLNPRLPMQKYLYCKNCGKEFHFR